MFTRRNGEVHVVEYSEMPAELEPLLRPRGARGLELGAARRLPLAELLEPPVARLRRVAEPRHRRRHLVPEAVPVGDVGRGLVGPVEVLGQDPAGEFQSRGAAQDRSIAEVVRSAGTSLVSMRPTTYGIDGVGQPAVDPRNLWHGWIKTQRYRGAARYYRAGRAASIL